MKRRYQAVTFDMGLTLVQMDSFASILQKVCASHGIATDIAALDLAVNQVWAEVMQQDAVTSYEASPEASRRWWHDVNVRTLAAAELPGSLWDTLEAEFMTGVDDPASYSIFPDSLPTLDALRAAGLRVGVISNWGWNLPDLCDAWGLTQHLDFVTTSARVGFAKPNARIFQAALDQAGTSADTLLHVGDSAYADVGGAQHAGIDAVLVSRDGRTAVADCPVIADLRELLPMLGLPAGA